jgi:hypothetical protein
MARVVVVVVVVAVVAVVALVAVVPRELKLTVVESRRSGGETSVTSHP